MKIPHPSTMTPSSKIADLVLFNVFSSATKEFHRSDGQSFDLSSPRTYSAFVAFVTQMVIVMDHHAIHAAKIFCSRCCQHTYQQLHIKPLLPPPLSGQVHIITNASALPLQITSSSGASSILPRASTFLGSILFRIYIC